MGQNENIKEKVKGTWAITGQEIEINRVWAEHRFTDEELNELFAGNEITIEGLKSKKGSTYGVVGKLSEQTYNDNDFIGFERLRFVEKVGVPDVWCKYKFSAAEKTTLEAGDSVEIKNAVGKNGKKFSCRVRYTQRDDGTMGIVPEFD